MTTAESKDGNHQQPLELLLWLSTRPGVSLTAHLTKLKKKKKKQKRVGSF
jgi:hypothetical protein